MIKCSKCNSMPSDNDVIGWKCNSCGKAFQVKKAQLQSILVKKKANPEQRLCKCPSCGNGLDDGNESIAWKCSCGHVNMGNLHDFEEKAEVEEKESKEEVVPDVPKSHLIACSECGKEISSKAKKCVHCGKVFVEEKPQVKICDDCGKEVAVSATECPYCGCPFEEQGLHKVDTIIKSKAVKKNFTKMVIPIALLALVVGIGGVIYNIKVVKPKKVVARNKATYEEASVLLEKGKYNEADELLKTIDGYKDVAKIREELKYESYAYSAVNAVKEILKNPDSISVYDVNFYSGRESSKKDSDTENDSEESDTIINEEHPYIIVHLGAQNGFGGNTESYAL